MLLVNILARSMLMFRDMLPLSARVDLKKHWIWKGAEIPWLVSAAGYAIIHVKIAAAAEISTSRLPLQL